MLRINAIIINYSSRVITQLLEATQLMAAFRRRWLWDHVTRLRLTSPARHSWRHWWRSSYPEHCVRP